MVHHPLHACLTQARLLLLLGVASAAVWGAEQPPPAHCRAAMDSFCNNAVYMSGCLREVKEKGGALPLVALFDRGSQGPDQAWRCYSPSCLNGNRTAYDPNSPQCTNVGLYCTESQLADILDNCTHPHPAPTGMCLPGQRLVSTRGSLDSSSQAEWMRKLSSEQSG